MSERVVESHLQDWITTTLGELCAAGGGNIQTGPFGSQLHASDYVPFGIPSVMPQNIGDNIIIEDGIARITTEDAARLSRYLLRDGDIVYSRRGDVERRALVRPSEDGWLCGTGCLRVRLGDSAEAPFISYYLGHPNVREWIVRHAVGATMPNLNTRILSAVPVLLPPRHTQKAIAALLGALDNKIAANGRIAHNARQLGDALLKESSVSWRAMRISDLASEGMLAFGDGYRTKRAEHGRPGLPILRVAEVRDGWIDAALEDYVSDHYLPAMGAKLSKPGDVVLTTKGTVGRVAVIRRDSPEFVYSPQLCYFRPLQSGPLTTAFLFFWFRSESFWSQAHSLKSQTDMADYLNLGDIRSLRIEVPASTEAHAVVAKLDALEKTASQCHLESESLAELRDTLLPKLISGEVQIREAEKVVENAV
ncbi:specificity protein S [Microtetraspora sp. NBRC 13810]|uniref:restriction endonuclease subunit S n=1 Tax=Microtetraspora sp. NBRC 13810 TaxID=3030990 RepID=UPI0024A0EA36|nr:restriction endonuclease subunit S [Microtetraspora sp. NBRC 13810]GLW08729.1 specificity protein S [Microtetraspora sp. NBRC 13810]